MRLPTCAVLLLFQATLMAAPPVATLPVEVQGGAIYVSVPVNGSKPLSLLWDTAAGWHAVNLRAAQEAGLPMKEHPSGAEGAGDGRSRAFEIRGATVGLGRLDVPFGPATAINLDAVSLRRGRVLDGLLGAPLLKRYVVVTDPDRGVMEFHEPEGWTYQGKGEEIAVRADEMGVPHVKVRFQLAGKETMEGEFVIDSAASGSSLVFSAPYSAANDLPGRLRAAGVKLLADEIAGVGGTSRMWYTRLASAQLGSTRFDGPVVGLTEAKGGTLARKDLAGLIGGALMHRFRVTYDIPRGRIFVEPGMRIREPFEEDMSGLRWALADVSRNDFQVRAVVPGSAAERAGFVQGDVLVSLDGRPAAKIGIVELRSRLREHGGTVKMMVRRGRREWPMTLKLERQL